MAAPKKQKVVNYPPKGIASVRFEPSGKKTTIFKSGKTVVTKPKKKK